MGYLYILIKEILETADFTIFPPYCKETTQNIALLLINLINFAFIYTGIIVLHCMFLYTYYVVPLIIFFNYSYYILAQKQIYVDLNEDYTEVPKTFLNEVFLRIICPSCVERTFYKTFLKKLKVQTNFYQKYYAKAT